MNRHLLTCNCHRTLGGDGALRDDVVLRGGKPGDRDSGGERRARHTGFSLSCGALLR